jgi:hypothetical protein
MSKNNTMEPEPQEIWDAWQEWKDGDDSDLYDAGYYDGILKALEIINDVRNAANVERVPFHLTMSAVASTLREILKGK